MLAIFLPQSSELLKFDNSINNMDLLPSAAATPDAGFSDLLQLGLDQLPTVEIEVGEILPRGGSTLPLDQDAATVPTELLAPLEPVADEIAPIQPLPEISLPGIELQLSAGDPLETPAVDEHQLAADSAQALIPVAAERAVQPTTDNVRAAARAHAREAEPPRLVTPAAARAPDPVEAIRSANGDVEAPLIRPLVNTRAEPARRTELPAVPEALSQSTQSAPAQESLSRSVASATQILTPADGLRDDAGLKAQSLQQLTQTVSQASVTHGQATQISSTITPSAQQPAPVSTANSLPGQAGLIETSVADSAWGDRLGERVLLMAGSQLRNAEIRLTPAELGPLRVQVAVDEGTANITFHAQHAVTRDAIEQALPRLREMLVENGLSLGQASVGEQGVAGQGNASREDGDELVSLVADRDEAKEQSATDFASADSGTRVTHGLVDTFA